MFRPAARALARAPTVAARTPAHRRLISTGPTKSRSWKNTFLRLGLAGGAVYYYNTSSVFSEEPKFSILSSIRKQNSDDASPQTLDSITPKIRQERAAAQSQKSEPTALEGDLNAQELQEEASQEAAFNPETGEINWDCPCLGGMAHGPCGENFKAAFSCFVFSEEEPKGIDCIDKFKAMQDCFRQYPEVYGAELEDDDEPQPQSDAPASSEASATPEISTTAAELDALSNPTEKQARAKDVHAEVKADAAAAGENSEGDFLIPKAAHDADEKNPATKA
ncbi:Mitochondrial intermembrane space protein Mia40 [Penicillium digitatum]|uniref:Mitochondrial intermembrane space import and assembly protein 40 n=3 Tax=Penicillium digitatum TaxID=36651 RepID=K9GGY6_PEND2|nr:Mitochondrial intermembrane space protein Mia40 [Penicillium digitatum Pd1]EKV11896.1 Mitochondrial intermembrane space protein Mia40 [Penicillium digitatum Pd1]EKV14018.1 Mitochondrial intermembrane space protein Mia40 [Penicillium digitatum PHI26]QQK42985.1 Mitochondrial intermembrane space protein Mia40 [Penicillium digitatum]